MKHHHEEEKDLSSLYYLVGLISGLFTGIVIDKGFTLVIILGIFGLMFTGFFLNTLVRGRGDA